MKLRTRIEIGTSWMRWAQEHSGLSLALVICLIALTGCQSAPQQRSTTNRTPTSLDDSGIDPFRLKGEVVGYAQIFSAEVAGTGSEIAANTTDRRVREMTLRWKMASIPAIQQTILAPDARRGLLAAWAITTELLLYFTEGQGRDMFGDQQQLAVDTVRRLESRVVSIARAYFPSEIVDQTKQELEEYTRSNPVASAFRGHDLDVPVDQTPGNGIDMILGVPLLPFKALGGVGDVAVEMHKIALVVEAFTRVARNLPQQTRWQTELMMLELNDSQTLIETRRTFDRVATSMESVASTAEGLPDEIRIELKKVLDAVSTEQENLRATIDAADATVQKINVALDQADRITTNVHDTLEDMSATSAEVAAAGEAWAETGREMTTLATKIVELTEESDQPDDTPPFDINDYTRAAVEMRATVETMNELLIAADSADMQRLLASMNEASRSAVDYAGGRTDALVNHLTVRALMLIGVFFVGLILYRVILARVTTAQ